MARMKHLSGLTENPASVMGETAGDGSIKKYTIGQYTAIYGVSRFQAYAAEALRKAELLQKVRKLSPGERHTGIKELCKEYDCSIRSVYHWESIYNREGFVGLLPKPRSDKGTSKKMTDEEVGFIRETYLQPCQPSKQHVYKAYLIMAQREGWEPASRATVFRHLKRISRVKRPW